MGIEDAPEPGLTLEQVEQAAAERARFIAKDAFEMVEVESADRFVEFFGGWLEMERLIGSGNIERLKAIDRGEEFS